ncbi:MAG: hypothetical protein KKB50_09845 [Planctomycetes bacterium]|nr:hypothetical protein [Planctomycetota bacterium]
MTRNYHILVCSLLSTVIAFEVASAQVPYKTRSDIISYGATAIDSPYIWGGGNWDPDDRDYGGADCSGFVCKSWSLTRWTPYRVNYHGPYSTASLIQTPGAYWDEIDRSAMLYGDAIVYRYDNNQSGHTYLYLSGDGWGEHEVYEARGTDYGIVHRWRTAYSGADITKGIRRDSLIESVDVTEHIVEADDGAPAYTDVGMTGSSQYDSYARGCQEGDCRYHWVTTARQQTCTYRPVLPETGRYRVYVTCNEDSPNVHNVGVTVNHALGGERFLWDQADADSLNLWVPVGSGGFLFNAGEGGTVVWDDAEAWPTTGDHVFRGDATKFVLDNRVVVDGVGGDPGVFASLSAALAWLANHESEEPDIINITCDTLVETGCLEINLIDDVTINGDADENGVPVTIISTPGVPADWSRSCALYLDIPIQHHYTLRDIVLVPQYVSAGYATNAYGLVVDEQNPSGAACATVLTLENVTVAGSLPGNIATDPQSDARAAATMFGGTDADYGASVLQRTATWAGDDACRQTAFANGLTITHSATRGLALRAAYTAWDIDGGLLVTYCTLAGVQADHPGSNTLGIRDSAGTRPNLIAGNTGGGLFVIGDTGSETVNLSNCLVAGNSSDAGGGIRCENATVVLRDCVLAGNSAALQGGAVWAADGTVLIANCTLADNSCVDGGAVYNWFASMSVSDSIIWNNGDDPLQGSMTVAYSDVQGGAGGTGNIAADPFFVDPDGPDNLATTWQDNDYHLASSSPCIDAGDPAFVPQPGETDMDGDVRVCDGDNNGDARVDMGADERGSFSRGDLNCDGAVNGFDIDVFVLVLGSTPPYDDYYGVYPDCDHTLADCNGDGQVNGFDIDAFTALLGGG